MTTSFARWTIAKNKTPISILRNGVSMELLHYLLRKSSCLWLSQEVPLGEHNGIAGDGCSDSLRSFRVNQRKRDGASRQKQKRFQTVDRTLQVLICHPRLSREIGQLVLNYGTADTWHPWYYAFHHSSRWKGMSSLFLPQLRDNQNQDPPQQSK